MKRKALAVVLAAAMTANIGAVTTFAKDAEGTHIYVLTASEDHGWTGSVATFAKEKAEEMIDAFLAKDESMLMECLIDPMDLV